MTEKKETIKTSIWFEEPMADNPYVADACYCSGYDVYGELLGKISWVEYLYLLFKLELPSQDQADLLETIAVAIAHPGVRDLSVRAAMNAGVGRSSRASALMAAIAVGAGNLGGGREIVQMMRLWNLFGCDINAWQEYIKNPPAEEPLDVWTPMEHVPGFDPNGASCSKVVQDSLESLSNIANGKYLTWLSQNRAQLENMIGYPLALSGVVATGFMELGFDEARAEILYLLLRLPGAAVHALEQEKFGWKQYPFFGDSIKPMADDEYYRVLKELESKE